MIPEVLNQTWKTKEIPPEWQASYNSCQNILAPYDRILWTDADMEAFVKENYPEMYEHYMSYPYHIQRCDSFRYMLLFKMGGIYIDLDIMCKRILDPLLMNDLVVSRSSNVGKYLTNSFLMAVPRHPFFRFVIDHLVEYKDKYSWAGKHFHVMHSTGPIFLTNMLERYTEQYGEIPKLYVMDKAEFSGDCNACSLKQCSGGQYFTHVTGESWHNWDSKVWNALMCNWRKIVLATVVIAVCVYYIRKRKRPMW